MFMTNQKEKIQGLVVLLKVNDKVYEVYLTELVKREIYEKINGNGITLVGEDLGGTIDF